VFDGMGEGGREGEEDMGGGEGGGPSDMLGEEAGEGYGGRWRGVSEAGYQVAEEERGGGLGCDLNLREKTRLEWPAFVRPYLTYKDGESAMGRGVGHVCL
jgi:hypothetical protein